MCWKEPFFGLTTGGPASPLAHWKKVFFAWPGAGYSSVREEEVNSKLVFTWKYNFETLIGVREKTCLEFFLTVYKLVWDFRIIPPPPQWLVAKGQEIFLEEGEGGTERTRGKQSQRHPSLGNGILASASIESDSSSVMAERRPQGNQALTLDTHTGESVLLNRHSE